MNDFTDFVEDAFSDAGDVFGRISGTLLDKNGKAIKDIATFAFGPAIQTEQEKLVAAFDSLTLALQDLTLQLAVSQGVPPVVGAATGSGYGSSRSGYEAGGFTGGGGNVNITIQAWDGQSVGNWLHGGGAKQITDAIVPELPAAVKARTGY